MLITVWTQFELHYDFYWSSSQWWKSNQGNKSLDAQKLFSSLFPPSACGIKAAHSWVPTNCFFQTNTNSLFFLMGHWTFPQWCMHQQTCWYDLKGHVLFTLTEAFQNFDEGVPLKDSTVTLQQQQLEPKPNWLMLCIKNSFSYSTCISKVQPRWTRMDGLTYGGVKA